MTRQEELTYLFGILSEASKWTASPDDNRDLVRMEVEERIHNLINGVEPEPDENGLIQSSIHPDNPKTVTKPGEFVDTVEEPLNEDDFKALEAARLNEHLSKRNKAREKWKTDKVRCQENGKSVWHPERECHQEKLFPNNPKAKKFRWIWDGPSSPTVDKNLPTKSEQEEAMWAEHENSNKEN